MLRSLIGYVGPSFTFGLAFLLACASFSEVAAREGSELYVRDHGQLVLRIPDSEELLVKLAAYRPPQIARDQVGLLAYHYASHVYERPDLASRTLGLVRRGTLLVAKGPVAGTGCPGGKWYSLPERGYACDGRGFTTALNDKRARQRVPRPDVTRALPFQYGKASSRSALRYYRIPSDGEARSAKQAVAKGAKLPKIVRDRLDGDYFVAIDRAEGNYYRTVLGRYVRADEVDLKPEPGMHGELLGGDKRLPLAFVYGESSVPLLSRQSGKVEQLGSAQKHARFRATSEEQWQGKAVVVTQLGYGVERKHLRIARRHERPSGVSANEPWLHVELSEQTLVAYRGDQPVFATLVSSGREGLETPTGLFRIRDKHKTVTMRGADKSGPFEVAEVPWSMFYSGNYALHGAYWHNDFGKVRSHGCINLAPVDARWLFQWTAGALPAGWHALLRLKSTALLITDKG